LFDALLLLKVNGAPYWNQYSVAEAMETLDPNAVDDDSDDDSVALEGSHVER
jgi:hypothetical protein